jgi:hypothetical protein
VRDKCDVVDTCVGVVEFLRACIFAVGAKRQKHQRRSQPQTRVCGGGLIVEYTEQLGGPGACPPGIVFYF